MRLSYTVSQDTNTKLWYVHRLGLSYIPVMAEEGTFFKTKRKALHVAANYQGLPYNEYMMLRRECL